MVLEGVFGARGRLGFASVGRRYASPLAGLLGPAFFRYAQKTWSGLRPRLRSAGPAQPFFQFWAIFFGTNFF